MNRRDRDRYNRDDYDYSGGTGYDRSDEHYHSARNMRHEFEQDYQRHMGDRGDERNQDQEWGRERGRYMPYRSYHEGNELGDTYERLQEGRGAVRSDTSYDMIYGERDESASRGYDRGSYGQDRYNRDRGGFRNYQDENRRIGQQQQRHHRHGLTDQERVRQGYGISSFEGTSDRYNTLNSDQNRWVSDESYYPGERDRRSSYRDRDRYRWEDR